MYRKYEIKTMQKDIEALVKKGAAPEGLPVESPKPPKPDKPKSTIPAPPKPKPIKKKPSKKYGPYHILGKAFSKQAVISVIFIAIILLIAGGVYYWWNYMRAPEKTEPEISTPLIEVDETDIIKIKQGEESDLVEKLRQVFLYEPEKGVLKRVLVKKETPEEYYFISFEEFFEIMGLNIPVDIVNNLDTKYTLFIYLQGGGNMFGFVVEVGVSEDLKDNLKAWEKTMAEDLRPIFLDHQLEEPATEEFQDNTYKNVNIRYLNFSDPSLTIDYAVIEDYLIITTSKESMYGVIDRILEKDPTIAWKTYRNEEYGFELKYPKDFEQQEDNATSKLFSASEGHFWIFIEDNDKNLEAEEIKNDYYENDEYGYQYQDSFLDINEISSYKQGRYDLGVIENYYIPKNEKIFKIQFEFNFDIPDEKLKGEKMDLINQILSTFKFLE